MKKKIIFLVTSMFLLTGCSATYNLEIYNNKIKEKLEYVNYDQESWYQEVKYGLTYRELVDSSISYPYPVFDSTVVDEDDRIKLDGVEYYKNELIEDNSKLGQKLSFNNFKISNFNDSSIIKKCYKHFNIIETNDKITFSTSLENLCFDEYKNLDDITIKIKTNHKIIESNATSKKGYHLNWNINRENKDDAGIIFTIKKNEFVFNYENEFVKKIIYIISFVGIILIVGNVTYKHFKNKNEKLNEI